MGGCATGGLSGNTSADGNVSRIVLVAFDECRQCKGQRYIRSDITAVVSEVVVVEQILIRNLPAGTKAALRARAERRHRSVEAEARDVLTAAFERDPVTLLDLLSTDEGADIEFEPERLGLTSQLRGAVRYLLDTHVVSALRVRGRNLSVEAWVASVPLV